MLALIFNQNLFFLGVFFMSNLFKVAGVSTLNGEVKVRFANDMTRVKVLTKNGHTDIELMELSEAMDKPAVVTFLKTTELYANPVFQAAIDAADAKYNSSSVVKVTKAKSTPNMEDLKARAIAELATTE